MCILIHNIVAFTITLPAPSLAPSSRLVRDVACETSLLLLEKKDVMGGAALPLHMDNITCI